MKCEVSSKSRLLAILLEQLFLNLLTGRLVTKWAKI